MSRIMVVEDETGVRQIICEWLTGEGYTVLDFPSAEEAVQWFATGTEPPDAALVDIKLAGRMNGFDLADALTEKYGFNDVIFVTSFFWEEETRAELAARRRPYFEKPLKFRGEVLPFLKRYLEKRS